VCYNAACWVAQLESTLPASGGLASGHSGGGICDIGIEGFNSGEAEETNRSREWPKLTKLVGLTDFTILRVHPKKITRECG